VGGVSERCQLSRSAVSALEQVGEQIEGACGWAYDGAREALK